MRKLIESLLSRRTVLVVLSGVASFVTSIPLWLAGGQKAQQKAAQKKREPLVIPDVPRDQVICFCLYTLHQRTLKLSAQLYPLKATEERRVHLEIERVGTWQRIASQDVNPEGWLATFRVTDWDDTRAWNYRVTHASGANYGGVVRKNPVDKDEIVVGNLSCNGNNDRGPRPDIVANLKAQDPDLLLFLGDQSYDHRDHYAAWLLFGRQFGEILKDRPTVTIPDDHDVGHPNLWGAGGKRSARTDGSDGGYFMPAAYVNEVQRAQCSHLPDPFDPTPVEQGITVHYTSLNVGGIDIAIIEDRKWKTGPLGVVPPMGPRPDHITDPNYDPAAIDLPEAQLLGERQLTFLRDWAQRWDGVVMKAVASGTVFCGAAHLHGQIENRLHADLDSNGWPQSGRNAALREIRRAFAFMFGGDQHLATVVHHGINDWDDAGVSFVSPSISNIYRRWWSPKEDPIAHDPASPLPFTGQFHDGFGNKLTMHAYANPNDAHPFATGYGLVRFNKPTREITIECWPRGVDVTAPDAKQFPGWPVTIRQADNYSRKPLAYLPTLEFVGTSNPVVQVIDESGGEVVYTLRILGTEFRPKVFRTGSHTIKVTDGPRQRTFRGIAALPSDKTDLLKIEL